MISCIARRENRHRQETRSICQSCYFVCEACENSIAGLVGELGEIHVALSYAGMLQFRSLQRDDFIGFSASEAVRGRTSFGGSKVRIV
jgi:hypothetical protein